MQRTLTIFLITLLLFQSVVAFSASPENVYEPEIYHGPVIESATPWYQERWVWVLLIAVIGAAVLAASSNGTTEGGVGTGGAGSGDSNGGTVIFRGPSIQ